MLAAAVAAVAARDLRSADDAVVIPGKRPMILHNDRPEDLETPARYFDSWITPVDSFFVRQHLPRPPAIDPATYQLVIDGMVPRPVRLSLESLRQLPQYTVAATLECTGNGRAFYTPKVAGVQWGRGAVGNAEWRGPRLSDVLAAAGMAADGPAYVEFDGADKGLASTPDFIRSLPMRKALHPATLLALTMNGQSPAIHGFPVRLVVPGWDGTSWLKWVTRISPGPRISGGFFMNPAYRIPKYNLPPGTPARPAELEVIEGMPVKSSIMAPEDQAKLRVGKVAIRGIAWAGEEVIERVEVSTDGGARWHEAALSGPSQHFAWRLWELPWAPAQPGYYTILSRATDSAGRVQPIVPAWNPSGYLWNGIDRIGVTVEAA